MESLLIVYGDNGNDLYDFEIIQHRLKRHCRDLHYKDTYLLPKSIGPDNIG